MAAPAHRYVTLEEYERLERESEIRNEWFDGEIVAMSGASIAHVEIANSLYKVLVKALGDGSCQPYMTDLRIKTRLLRAYPDVTVVCGKPHYDLDLPLATIDNPTVLFEVLSPSTASFDRGAKFEQYRGLASLRDFVVVAQDRIFVEHYARQGDDIWLLTDLKGPDAVLELTGTPVKIPLAALYERVEFPTRAASEDVEPQG